MKGQIKVLALAQSASDQNKVYEIRKGKDGMVYCTCASWRYRGYCRHLDHFHATHSILEVANA